jgi:hypothetical protein
MLERRKKQFEKIFKDNKERMIMDKEELMNRRVLFRGT